MTYEEKESTDTFCEEEILIAEEEACRKENSMFNKERILKLVEEGMITKNEADRLLAAFKKSYCD
jgi:hypothetical protein